MPDRSLSSVAPGANRIRGFRETVFAEMSALSMQHGAVNLGQGFPDFPGPIFVKEAAKRAIDADLNQYAHPHGVLPLRQAVAHDWQARFDIEVDPVRQITVTSGATEAVFDIIVALLNPGDELIVFEPFYDSYLASVEMAGGVLRTVRLEAPDWTFDPAELEAVVNSRSRAILLNTPHNPTGKVFDLAELEVIANIAKEHDLIVITDEVYDRIIFDDAQHIPIAILPGMWERTLTLNSVGKTFSLTGWKVGYAVGPERLIDPLRAVHQWVTFATATPFQFAMADAMTEARTNGYYGDLVEAYTARRAALTDVLVRAGLRVLRSAGSFFLMTSYDHFSAATDVEFSRWLITEIGVTPIPPSAFYLEPATAPRLVRFCFAKELETIREAGLRLSRLATVTAPSPTIEVTGISR